MLILHFDCFTEEHVFDNEVIVQYVMEVICTSSLQARNWFQWPCDRPISHWWHRGLAVEFDMYRNPDLGELSGNHISVHVPPRKGGPVVEEMFGMRS